MTLEQRRAQDAWQRAQRYTQEHVKIAKALPALIINSGLMQVLAFCHQKNDKHELVASDLRAWLQSRFPQLLRSSDFSTFMEALMQASPRDFQAVTAEAFAWLKWMRQMAAARVKGD
ncbi:type III-B CRISPR module-associated protein Cmr5 [Tepidicella xavieri]|nr:type III-B CRISPR module-associated protein Cmr5 [Tepidicella xavieri]